MTINLATRNRFLGRELRLERTPDFAIVTGISEIDHSGLVDTANGLPWGEPILVWSTNGGASDALAYTLARGVTNQQVLWLSPTRAGCWVPNASAPAEEAYVLQALTGGAARSRFQVEQAISRHGAPRGVIFIDCFGGYFQRHRTIRVREMGETAIALGWTPVYVMRWYPGVNARELPARRFEIRKARRGAYVYGGTERRPWYILTSLSISPTEYYSDRRTRNLYLSDRGFLFPVQGR